MNYPPFNNNWPLQYPCLMQYSIFSKKDTPIGFTLQHDQRDCGVACLLSLVRYYGGDATFEQVRRLCGADLSGTTLLGLKEAATALGFEAEGCEANLPSLIEHGKPTILHVELEGGLRHYVVWYGGRFIIGDPATGIVEWTESELKHYWKGGICLTCSPSAGFESKAMAQQQKWEWVRELVQSDYPILAISATLGVLMAGLGVAMSVYSQQLIDRIIPSHRADKLIVATILVVVLLLARVGLTALRQMLLLQQSRDFGLRMNTAFFEKLLHLPKPFFDTRKIGDFVARLNDTQRIQNTISTLAGNLLVDLFLCLAAFGLLFYYDRSIGLVSLLILPAYFLLIYSQNKGIIAAQTNVMTAYSLSESNYINTIQGIADIKNRNKEEYFGEVNKSLYQHFQSTVYALGMVQTKLSVKANMATVGFIAMVLVLTLQKVYNAQMQIGEMTAILGAISMLLPSVSNLALISIPLNEAKVAFERMHEYIKNSQFTPPP